MEQLIRWAESQGCRCVACQPMSELTSFRIGGPVDAYIVSPNEAVTAQVWACCKEKGIPFRVMGCGTNLLVSDGGLRGVVLRQKPTEPYFDGETVTASAGMSLNRLCVAVRDKGLSGLEFAYGIPGSVGGGAYMNAGAYGGTLSDVVTSVRAITSHGVREYAADELLFAYRHSRFMEEEGIITAVTLRLTFGDRKEITAKMEDLMDRRRTKQPLEYPSAGSFFKRPSNGYASEMIDRCGLKGLSEGGAQISEKHAGFLINRGGATCEQVCRLADRVRQIVKENCDADLEFEVRMWGEAEG